MELSRLEEKLARYAQEHKISALYLFGSVAQGTLTPLSDLDVAVLLPESDPPEEYFDRQLQMTIDLMEVLGTDKIDLVVLNQAPPLLKYKVITTGKLLYNHDKRAHQRFAARALAEYLDFKPVLQLQSAYLKRRIKEGQFGVRPTNYRRTPKKA